MEIKTITLPTRQIEVEVYTPTQSTEKLPAILLLHELYGVIDAYREDAQDLADRGYLVYVPNLYSGGVVKYCIRAMVAKAGRSNAADSDVNKEIHVLLDALKVDPRSNGRLGMLGQCLTGGYVIQMAKREDMLAPVVYHHSLGIEGAGVPKTESLDEIRLLQGHWSDQFDPFCPAKKRNKLIEQLGDRVEAYTYPMPHGFRTVSRDRPESALVWQRTVEFFDRELKQKVI
ncbi:dienelactone hydrolase [Acinetobacter halotolerans]|uniref:Dienelactone hydrolase n=1 Tax=Acinetobacter halotolerans TaxID=1752076 RepID=A0A4Q6X9A3_9GAMM|nr:dienelactone hydrolase family protein [Acinetobacter halotolerans]RZF50437.1 dienelactone hydrolase [Acinetobacter halotolerans]